MLGFCWCWVSTCRSLPNYCHAFIHARYCMQTPKYYQCCVCVTLDSQVILYVRNLVLIFIVSLCSWLWQYSVLKTALKGNRQMFINLDLRLEPSILYTLHTPSFPNTSSKVCALMQFVQASALDLLNSIINLISTLIQSMVSRNECVMGCYSN